MSHASRAILRAFARRRRGVSASEVAAALERLGPFLEPPSLEEVAKAPIFVLATGWRTGSTLLQRALMTDRRLLLWGEPLGRMGLLPRLAEAVCGMQPGWPPAEFWIDRRPGEDLTTAWIANLFPPAEDLRGALRTLLERWLAEPARQRGFSRWGLKEVRLGSPEAVLLRWLYPAARVVVITREPTAAYRSVRASAKEWTLYARWPDRRVDCAVTFARHWDDLAASWAQAAAAGAPFVVRYEDLVLPGYDLSPLAEHLALDLAPAPALAAHVGGTGDSTALGRVETLLVRRETVTGRRVMGYGSRAATR